MPDPDKPATSQGNLKPSTILDVMINPLKRLRFPQRRKSASSGQTAASSQTAASGQAAPSSSPPPSNRTKSLAELEKEIEAEIAAEAQRLKAERQKLNPPLRKVARLPRYVLSLLLLAGLPIGFLWLMNLPYPPIRRPVARSAPLLLLPSYIRFDNQYKTAINQVEQAKQLIDQSTSLADLSQGAEKLEQANESLNGLPIWIESEWQDVAGANSWYAFAYTPLGFNMARAEVGRLQAKMSQEKNAETMLLEIEKRIAAAKQQYATAQTLLAQKTASSQWQNAIEQLTQIPPETLAGRIAQSKHETAQNELVAVFGQSSTSQSQVEIEAAAQFALKASQAAQNPPHTVDEWNRVESLWQQAIDRLSRVSKEDEVGYRQAQAKLAQYQDNLEQIQIRRKREAASVEALRQAQALTDDLVKYPPSNRQAIGVTLQQIMRELKQVENGTTVYQEAQKLLQDAQRKLDEITAKAKQQ